MIKKAELGNLAWSLIKIGFLIHISQIEIIHPNTGWVGQPVLFPEFESLPKPVHRDEQRMQVQRGLDAPMRDRGCQGVRHFVMVALVW